MLAILFLGEAAGELAETDGILGYGLAIGAVLAAVALVVWVFQRVVSAQEEPVLRCSRRRVVKRLRRSPAMLRDEEQAPEIEVSVGQASVTYVNSPD
jgi:hypothetical protein